MTESSALLMKYEGNDGKSTLCMQHSDPWLSLVELRNAICLDICHENSDEIRRLEYFRLRERSCRVKNNSSKFNINITKKKTCYTTS